MRYLFFFVFIFFVTPKVNSQNVGLNEKEISKLKKLIRNDISVGKFYQALKSRADDALNQIPNPIDTVISEGHLATDPKKIVTQKSLKDIDKIYALAFAWKIEGNTPYLIKLSDFFTAWAKVNKPQGNPINDTKFENLFIAYDLVKDDIFSNQKKAIDDWLAKIASEEVRTGMNKAKTTSFNNWNSHRLKVIGLIAYILNNNDYKKHIDIELPVQIEKNLFPDGSGFDFLERDALHYHVYTLEPLLSLATVLKRATGEDYYNYVSTSGASIHKSIDFLIPFVKGDKTHGEYVNSKVAFDKKRADNKEPGFEIGANFKPERGIAVITQAAYFQPSCMEVVKKVLGSEKVFPTWQSVLIAITGNN